MASHLAQLEDRSVLAIIGDMRELGTEEDARHKELWETLRNIPSVRYIFVGALCEKIILPLMTLSEKQFASFFRDSRKAGDEAYSLIQQSEKGILVFAKGSQNTLYLEEALKKIILPEEINQLVRQDDFYMQKKQMFWNTLD